MHRIFLLTMSCVTLAMPATAAEPGFATYRGITLGDSVDMVVGQLMATPSDVKVVHARPTLVQQLTWRPRRFVSGVTVEPDPLAEIVLTFHLGRLARIAATYDRERTQGLTDADLNDALSRVYGQSMLLSTSPRTTPPAFGASPDVIGRWGEADTLVVLSRESLQNGVRLTITSITADQALQAAIGAGERLDTSEAPARNLARREADAAALRAKDEVQRRDNKATFRP